MQQWLNFVGIVANIGFFFIITFLGELQSVIYNNNK